MSEQNMSLEKSMAALAAANLVLAEAMTKYAATIDKYGLKIAGANGDAPAAEKPKATGRGRKTEPAATPPADDGLGGDDDGFGNEGAGDGEPSAPDKLTADQVKAKLLEVRDAFGDKAPALKIINGFGYNAIPDVKPADFKKVWIECEKALKTAP